VRHGARHERGVGAEPAAGHRRAGTPPVFAGVVLYVAEEEGFFKQQGVDVTIRPFETGVAAARSVLAGDIAMSLTPTNMIISEMSNTSANFAAIYGFPNPDWVLASTDPGKTTCGDLAGQVVGVDIMGGARSTALSAMLDQGCPGVSMKDLRQVSVSSNVAPVLVAGRLSLGVLHLDDLAVLEAHGRTPFRVLEMSKTNPNAHYLLAVVRRDRLKEHRDAYVRTLAALIKAARFMQDGKNADRIAALAAITGLSKETGRLALGRFLDIKFWAVDDDGLDEHKLEATIALAVRTGGIQPGKRPVSLDRLVDRSVWQDAKKALK
jgi:NitT/TauT family transport system substrate-binding protein